MGLPYKGDEEIGGPLPSRQTREVEAHKFKTNMHGLCVYCGYPAYKGNHKPQSDPDEDQEQEDLKVGDKVVIESTHFPERGKITVILDGRYAVANDSDGWERWFDRENLRKISGMKEEV